MLGREEYRARDAVGLAALVRSGEVTAREVLEAAVAEIERLDPALNAVVMRNYDKARDDAGAVDRDTPLAGVPFPAKDVNVDVAGFPTTWACRFFADAPAQTRDSLLVSRWRAAGMVVPARTNTPEFATEFVCEPELYGPTANPWDRTRTPGGSSGGAAAAVASGMVPMAHATDSGGSIRVPAGCCGVFGFKPSSGLVATGSEYGPLVGGLNCDHAVTWTVRDSAALLDATAGPEVGAPTAYARPPAPSSRRSTGPSACFASVSQRCRRAVGLPPGKSRPRWKQPRPCWPISGIRCGRGPGRSPTMSATPPPCSGSASSPRRSSIAPGQSGGRHATTSWGRWLPGAWPRPRERTRFGSCMRAGRSGTGRSGWPGR